MPNQNKALHRLQYLLEACAQRDDRYQASYGHSVRATGLASARLSELPDFSEWSDTELIGETRQHLQSMLIGCVNRTGLMPDLHHQLQTIERSLP